MKLQNFPEQNIIFAETQPEYMPLPAFKSPYDPLNYGRVTCCWKLSWKERFRLLFTGVIWHSVLTFNDPLQPQLLSIDKPEMK